MAGYEMRTSYAVRLVALLVLLVFAAATGAADYQGPWRVAELQKPPRVEWLQTSGTTRQLFYANEPYRGQPTRVFAWYAEPANRKGKRPALVLVHGGGGTAFKEWAEIWAQRGYIALAMDLAGHGAERQRLADGGPDQNDASKFPRDKTAAAEMWSYHAVAAVIRGISLLQSLPHVDADKIGITGISWGGYLTCIVAGLDHRLKVAVPVYGCGFLYHNSAWVPTLEKMSSAWRKEWVRLFDPAKYVGQAKMPVLFVNGTNDFAYPLDSYQKTYRLVKNRTLCITVNMPHGHQQGWAPKEIGHFVDQHLAGGKPLLQLEHAPEVRAENGQPYVTLSLPHAEQEVAVRLHWTSAGAEPWSKRAWHSKDLSKSRGKTMDIYRSAMPKERPLVYFLTATDERHATVSTEHQVLEK